METCFRAKLIDHRYQQTSVSDGIVGLFRNSQLVGRDLLSQLKLPQAEPNQR